MLTISRTSTNARAKKPHALTNGRWTPKNPHPSMSGVGSGRVRPARLAKTGERGPYADPRETEW
jgi:hypothetical protein